MLAIMPNGRLNVAPNGAPAATLLILRSSTGAGATGTSVWVLFGLTACTTVGGPSLAGTGRMAPGGLVAASTIGSHETAGSAKVTTAASAIARLRPRKPVAGGGSTAMPMGAGCSIWTPNRSTLVERSSSVRTREGRTDGLGAATVPAGAPGGGMIPTVNPTSVAAPPAQVSIAPSSPIAGRSISGPASKSAA